MINKLEQRAPEPSDKFVTEATSMVNSQYSNSSWPEGRFPQHRSRCEHWAGQERAPMDIAQNTQNAQSAQSAQSAQNAQNEQNAENAQPEGVPASPRAREARSPAVRSGQFPRRSGSRSMSTVHW